MVKNGLYTYVFAEYCKVALRFFVVLARIERDFRRFGEGFIMVSIRLEHGYRTVTPRSTHGYSMVLNEVDTAFDKILTRVFFAREDSGKGPRTLPNHQ